MKLFAITIKPQSPFGTPLKGDTLFGSFCWQAAYDDTLLKGGLDHWIGQYREKPFLIISSAFPQIIETSGTIYALPRPAVPQGWLDSDDGSDCAERLKARKEKKARRWLLVGDDLQVIMNWDHLVDDQTLGRRIASAMNMKDSDHRFVRRYTQSHNTINRLTGTTGTGFFAPYSMDNFVYMPGMELVIFALTDEDALTEENLLTGFERIGAFGFGRDASTGLGRFGIGECEELTFPAPKNPGALLTLGPCVPGADEYDRAWFQPFTRFGRHGADLLHTGRPFKNPVVMADEGAVFRPVSREQFSKPYMGRSVSGISKAQPETVCQGYCPVLPMRLPAQEG
ncbi:type III-A CRISPR-associated RAMP protein Csm4 [Desulfolithobacter sp.]